MRRADKIRRRYLYRATQFVRRAGVSGLYFGLAVCAIDGLLGTLPQSSALVWIASAEARDDDWQREAKRQQRETEKEARRQQREMEQETRRQQREIEKEARRQSRETEQEARRQSREMEKAARNQQGTRSRDDQSTSSAVRREQNDDRATSATIEKGDNASGRKRESDNDSNRGSGSGKGKSDTAADGKQAQTERSSHQDNSESDNEVKKPWSPPRTVFELLEITKRVESPAKPKSEPAPVAATPAASTSNKPTAPPKTRKLAGEKPKVVVKKGGPDFELLEQGMFRPHEILVTNMSRADQKIAAAKGFKTASSVELPGDSGTVSSLIVPPGMSDTAALKFLENAAPSALFGPNHIYRVIPAADGAEPAAARDELATTGAAAKGIAGSANCAAGECFARDLLAWKPATKQCARRVRVGLIDTSFDVAHPAFSGKKFSVEQFNGNQAISRSDWHGTAVLSVLAGNAASSTPGLIPDAEFFLASTFRADAQGNAAADTISVLKALAWLDKSKVHIINMSFSGPRNDQIEVAIAAMAAKGVVFVAAAGNKGPSAPPSYPAAYPQVVAVTAVGKTLSSYRHANRGDYVDVSAPGVQVLTALPEGRQGYRTGTSFATPFVTGLLAAMPAVRKGVTGKEEMLSRVSFQDLGDSGRDPIYGEGLPQAPERCDAIGGVAVLPWFNAAKRMSVGAPTHSESTLARPASQ